MSGDEKLAFEEGRVQAYTLIVLITGKRTGKVDDILDYNYVNHLEQKEGILVRHCRKQTDVLGDSDMTVAGVMLLQIWVTGKTSQVEPDFSHNH